MNDAPGKPVFGPRNPYPAKILENRALNRQESTKKTLFLRLDLDGSGLAYLPGDLLGVLAKNEWDAVNDFLRTVGLNGGEIVKTARPGWEGTLSDALREALHFRARPTQWFLRQAAENAGSSIEKNALTAIAEDAGVFSSFAATRQIPEVLREFPSVRMPAETLAHALPPLAPRLYSVASSPLAHKNEVHIAASVVSYQENGVTRAGVATSYLEKEARAGTTLSIFTAKGRMRLPEKDRDIVMIGPGTGVAPFRGFLEERKAQGATGRNWLFYGHRTEANDYYFRDEFEAWAREGLLTKLSLAWSRDGARKRYVQDLLWEERAEFLRWMEGGAMLYLCGDRVHMAADVETTLTRIGNEVGKTSWLEELRSTRRYQTDAY